MEVGHTEMETEHGMDSSPMDTVYMWSGSKQQKNSKRKYQDDSGYITTPCSSQSASGLSWEICTPDDGFNESSSVAGSSWHPCDCPKNWEAWERTTPLLPSSPEAPITIPAISPTQPKIFRTRDLPSSSSFLSSNSSNLSLCRTTFQSRPEFIHSPTDFIFRFSVASNLPHILSHICSYLSDSDITSMTMVSKTWYDVITKNKDTRERWHNCITLRKSSKENLNSMEKNSWERSPLRVRNHSTPLRYVSTSPPVSPSKMNFHLYIKEAAKLKSDECLMHCPSCDRPSRCTPIEKRGKCSRVGCALEFCMKCCSPYHGTSPCVLLSPPGNRTPQKHLTKAQSRRNLRRLLL